MAEKWHPGITMHKISFGGGFIGLLFAAGSVLIFLLGLPALWYFVAFALALGIGVAAFLRIVAEHTEDNNKPLSIISTAEKTERSHSVPRQKWHRLFLFAARLSSS